MKKEDAKDPRKCTMETVMTELSKKISEAITPVDIFNAPILVLLLEDYAEEIKKIPEYSNEAYLFLREVVQHKTICTKYEENTSDDKEKGEKIYYGKL